MLESDPLPATPTDFTSEALTASFVALPAQPYEETFPPAVTPLCDTGVASNPLRREVGLWIDRFAGILNPADRRPTQELAEADLVTEMLVELRGVAVGQLAAPIANAAGLSPDKIKDDGR